MKKLCFFQVSDYRKNYYLLEKNNPETYIDQKKFIEFTANLLNKYGIREVSVVCFGVAEGYDQIMPNGVRAVGIPGSLTDEDQTQTAKKLIALAGLTRAIVQVPLPKLIKYLVRAKIKTLVMIADSFAGSGLRGLLWGKFFAWILNNSYVQVVSNHNYPASNVLKSFGVKAEKIVPWDFAWEYDINKYPIKVLTNNKKSWKFFYAGRIMEEKGIGDIIRAIYLLKQKSIEISAVFAGEGDIAFFEKRAADLAVSDRVNFINKVSHDQVLSGMRDADIVIVPSRIKSSEGMPCTIYESYMVKTPLILSDHPMMRQGIENGVFFEAGNPDSLVKAIGSLINDFNLYNRLSAESALALNKLIAPFNPIQIIEHWLSGQKEDKQWLFTHSLQQLNRK